MTSPITSLFGGSAGGAVSRASGPRRDADPPAESFSATLESARRSDAQRPERPEEPSSEAAEAAEAAEAEAAELAEDKRARRRRSSGQAESAELASLLGGTTAEAEAVAAEASTASTSGATSATPARAAGPVDPHRVRRDLASLNPEFRGKLERVIARMEKLGHNVEVVETFRDPARQEMLFEQGRTRPGPVVTWTLNSNHSHGRAADVLIDGSYGNPAAYQRLALIAEAEGLRTLGARDPGHVELPGAGTTSAPLTSLEAEGQPSTAAAGRMAEVAAVAKVAVPRVAQVAQVAQVARVATVAQVAQVGGASGEAARGRSEKDSGDSGSSQSGGSALPLELSFGDAGTRGLFNAELAPTSSVLGTDAAGRIARVLELQDGLSTSSLSSLLLKVDNPGGTQDHIRLDLRGSAISATLDMANAAEAGRLETRLGDLQRVLERHGLEAESLRVRASTEPADVARAAVVGELDKSGVASARTGSDTSSRERQGGKPQDHPSQQSDDSRQRSRREPKQEGKGS